MNSSPSEFEDDLEARPEARLQDRAAPAHPRSEATTSRISTSTPALPLRGEIFDVALDENGRLIEETPKPKTSPAWFFAGLATLFCVYNFGAYVGQRSKVPPPIGPFTPQIEKLKPLRIHISGKVKKPGVYTLPGGARIEDALQKAGGVASNADLSALNLADWAVDGSKIEVPARQSRVIEPTPTPVVIVREVFITPPQNAPDESAEAAPRVESPKAATAKSPKDEPKPRPRTRRKSSEDALILLRRNPVDLNRASAEQLSTLPGVGPKMAERILAYRAENGGFKSVADLDNVKGIGEKRMAVLRDLVKVK